MPESVILFKTRLWYRCFPANFAKFPRTPFLQNNPGRLPLKGRGTFRAMLKIFDGVFFAKLVNN